ncbi:MAG: tetratricopeptide repeat protein [Flavobacteriales bacterium]|nr:tetratricopeptide repeat protein [Flavobacteriales bacterium]
MKHLLRILFTSLVLVLAENANAQETDLELAEYYYNQGMFEQARLYYEKIYKTNKTTRVYNNYLNSLIALNDFEEAEKLAKKKVKEDSKDGVSYVKLGDLYKKFNRPDDATEQFEEAIRKVEPTRANIIRLANEFAQINEYQYALRAYQKGKAESKEGYNFSYEVANMQGNLGEFEAMTESFLDLIGTEPNYIQTVQNSLNRTLNLDENKENMDMLRVKLLKRTQQEPDKIIYTEMLAWLFMQKNDFASAYVQVASLDKRLNENGYRLMNLAQLALNNHDYETARKSYQSVIDKGPSGDYFITARIEKLQVMREELAHKPGSNPALYAELETAYQTALSDLGKTYETAVMMKELAHVQAFHLNKTDDAIALLRETIAMPGLYNKVLALCKLELGDILVFKGEIWEASLLFSQVELDFKDDVLGHEAKFRNSRISYYTGDFEWAQGQLDVLKASTSKLISNDAIDLSLLITDNFNMDTTQVPMQMFARADLLTYQNRFDVATMTLDSIMTMFPAHSLADEILMKKAEIQLKQGHYDIARDLYQEVINVYFIEITADDALFKLADMFQFIYNDNNKAMELYEKLITDFPGSLYVVEARKRFRSLRGDEIN